MKKKITKFIAVILTLLMAISVTPITSLAYNVGDICPSCGSGYLSVEYYGEKDHTFMCSNCGSYFSESHTFSEGVCINCDYKCPHNEYFISSDHINHWKTCKNCDYDFDTEAHSISYIQSDKYVHNVSCSYCGYFSEDEHNFENGVCTLCGAKENDSDTDPTGTYYTVTVDAGTNGKLKLDNELVMETYTYIFVDSGSEIHINDYSFFIDGQESLSAIPDDGYVFDSWSGVPSDNTVNSDLTITANFKAKSVNVDKSALASAITLGKTHTSKDYYQSLANLSFKIENGQEVYDDEEATQNEVDSAVAGIQSAINALQLKEYEVDICKNGEDIAVGAVQYGETFTVDADLDDGETVTKWVMTSNGVDTLLANNSNEVSIVVTSDTVLDYYTEYSSTGSSTTRAVKYLDKNERVVAIKSVEVGAAVDTSVVEEPTLAFYDFAGWETVQGNSECAGDLDIVLKATYTASKTEANKVTIIGLDGVTVQGETEYDAYYDEKVELAGGDNYVFCTEDRTEISGINDSYIYAPHLNKTIYIKAVSSKSADASTRITGSFTADGYFTINAQYYLPEGCTAVEAGVVVSSKVADPTIGADKCTKLVSSTQGVNHEYSISISCSSTGTLNTKSYLIYKDTSGNLKTVYSDASALSYGA